VGFSVASGLQIVRAKLQTSLLPENRRLVRYVSI
jgi:hypothetical protein